MTRWRHLPCRSRRGSVRGARSRERPPREQPLALPRGVRAEPWLADGPALRRVRRRRCTRRCGRTPFAQAEGKRRAARLVL